MSKQLKIRLDQLLVNKNLADSKTKAQSMIMAGQVLVNGKIITKSGNNINKDSNIIIKQLHPKWVSRGSLKLLKAIKYFNIEIKNKTCLDIGSSTGGFSQALLKYGAKKIFSVDVGTNQLHEKLQKEDNIISIENFNAKYLNDSIISEKIDLVVCDVSFISLKKVILPNIKLLKNKSIIIVLIKPQFESKKNETKKGVVKDFQIHERICDEIKEWFESECSSKVINIIESPIKGPKGNKEFLLTAKYQK